MAQVRLDADVEQALRQQAERAGTSLANETNRTLRRSLGLSAGVERAPSTATVSRPRGTLAGRWRHSNPTRR